MLFNSFDFLVLLGLTFLLFYTPLLRNYQTIILILSSMVFYGWFQPWLLILLLFSASINAAGSYLVLTTHTVLQKKMWATTGVVVNLSILCIFKYGPLSVETFGADFSNSTIQWILMIPLPLGISFYTFQGISLLIDVYRKPFDISLAQKFTITGNNYLNQCILFIIFFPQLVAGPIVKAHDFLPQIKIKFLKDIDWSLVCKSVIMGYFLKMVVADNLKDLTFWITWPYFLDLSSITLITMLFGFSMQIFADFAGYSLIAIGIAALFGYRLMDNFLFPYISETLSEFWRRWHISLSSWLKEYLYFPLGGNRKGPLRTYINMMIVMGLGGLWHGAAWSYMVWGLYHGLGLCIERLLGWRESEIHQTNYFRVIVVFCFVSLGWLLFKLPDFSQATQYFRAIFLNFRQTTDLGNALTILIYSSPVVLYHAAYLYARKRKISEPFKEIAYAICLFMILVNSGTPGQFIYFQF